MDRIRHRDRTAQPTRITTIARTGDTRTRNRKITSICAHPATDSQVQQDIWEASTRPALGTNRDWLVAMVSGTMHGGSHNISTRIECLAAVIGSQRFPHWMVVAVVMPSRDDLSTVPNQSQSRPRWHSLDLCPARCPACDHVALFGRLALLETTAISRPVIAYIPTKRTSINTQYDYIRRHEVAQLGCPAVVARHSHPSVCVHKYLPLSARFRGQSPQ